MLAIGAATDPEVAIVDDERVKAIFSELLRIGRHRDLTHIAPAASEHDSGPPPAFVGCVEPTPNSITFGLELYVQPLHPYPCPPPLHSLRGRPAPAWSSEGPRVGKTWV